MNSYITLDGYRYRASWRTWSPAEGEVPSSARLMLDASYDITYGPGMLLRWAGEVEGPVMAEAGEYGTIATLRTSLRKRQTLSFTDHYNVVYTVHSRGPNKERSLSPVWDGDSNIIYVTVSFSAVTA